MALGKKEIHGLHTSPVGLLGIVGGCTPTEVEENVAG